MVFEILIKLVVLWHVFVNERSDNFKIRKHSACDNTNRTIAQQTDNQYTTEQLGRKKNNMGCQS